jgi:hypothetical protein
VVTAVTSSPHVTPAARPGYPAFPTWPESSPGQVSAAAASVLMPGSAWRAAFLELRLCPWLPVAVRCGPGFGLGAGLFLRRLICVTELTKAELNAMIEEATVDCNDEEEALTVTRMTPGTRRPGN